MKMTVGVVGLGLIGASFAKAYKSDEEATVYGWNRTNSITQMAKMHQEPYNLFQLIQLTYHYG